MTRHEVHEILKIPFYERHAQGQLIFKWEHCAKKFYRIPKNLAMEHLMELHKNSNNEDNGRMVLKCEYAKSAYYFGVGLRDCENITLKKLRKLYDHATWYVYTWAD